MRKKAIVISCLGTVVLFGAGPTTKPIRSLDDVESKYKYEAAANRRNFEATMAKAVEDRREDLRILRARAMKDQDMDRAMQLQTKIDEAPDPAHDLVYVGTMGERRRLESRLVGSSWHGIGNKDSAWTLKLDGTFTVSSGGVGK